MADLLTYAAVLALITQPANQGGCGINFCGMAPAELMTRIVMHESGGNTDAWNVNKASQTRHETVDCGLSQINSDNWNWLGLDAVNCKNACRNLQAQATYLKALSTYATGNECKGFVLKPPGAQVSYVEDMASPRFKHPGGPTSPANPAGPKPISIVLHSSTRR